MYEENLKRIICLHPELIEAGFVVVGEEFPIRGNNATYRCDIKGKDVNNNNVFVELKLNANKDVVYQIAKYKTFLKEEGRYIVAALGFDSETKEVLSSLGFETMIINRESVLNLLEKEKDNPKLYQRYTKLAGEIKLKELNSAVIYTEQEREVVKSFMEGMLKVLENNKDLLNGYAIEGLDIRKRDEFRLILKSEKSHCDRLVIYNRSRKSNEIHFMYIPDFSFITQKSTKRKLKFQEFILLNKHRIQNLFNLALFNSRQVSGITEDHLEITSQAWKGFSQVIYRDLKLWQHQDFLEMLARKFFDYIDHILLLLEEFEN